MINKLNQRHTTTPGLLVFALIEFGLAYGFTSLAIDHGNLLYYLLALIFLFGALQNTAKLIRSLYRDQKHG